MSYSDTDGTIRKRSGWLIPLGVFLVTLALSALMLLFYLVPNATNFLVEQTSPTARTDIIALQVDDLKLWIPANYMQYESARQGGMQRDVALFALSPEMTGWSNWEQATFSGNPPDSPLVILNIREQHVNLSESDKLLRIYPAYLIDAKGTPGPFGLTQYTFKENNGYHNRDLFVGKTDGGPAVFLCDRALPEVPSPNCLRELPLTRTVALSYRFKREHLEHWSEIGQSILNLVTTFKKEPKPETAEIAPHRP